MGSGDSMRLSKDAVRLGQLVVARRVELGMRTSAALAEAANLTVRVIGDLESGRRSNFSQTTTASIEHALEWDIGSLKLALQGGQPRPIRRRHVTPQELRDHPPAPVSSRPPGQAHLAADPNDESSASPNNSELKQGSTVNALNAAILRQLDTIASLQLDITENDLTRIDRIKHEISSLPEALAPFLDSPAGIRHYMHRVETLSAKAMDIVETYSERGTAP